MKKTGYPAPFKASRLKSKETIALTTMLLALMMLAYIGFGQNVKAPKKVPPTSHTHTASPLHESAITTLSTGEKLINILMWTHNYTVPFNVFKAGRRSFVEGRCRYSNCYITNNRTHLSDITEWDAILFHAPEYTWDNLNAKINNHGHPERRRDRQVYIFACIESSGNYPVNNEKWDNYFNWTMTYRLDSEVPWIYLATKDRNDTLVAPKEDVEWIKDMEEISPEFKDKLKMKSTAVAWFVSNCNTLSKRETYAKKLQSILMDVYNKTMDIYGQCGNMKCSNNMDSDSEKCTKRLTSDYYFYLSFENTFSKDYTTEKLLRAMMDDIVPIVWGGSDYSRFAPPNSYINAREHQPEDMAKIINNLIINMDEYGKYYKWKKYYTYHDPYDSPDTNPFCKLCEALNDSEMRATRTYNQFRKWWNE